MGLLDSYRPVYDGLSDSEEAEVGEFAASCVSAVARGDTEALQKLAEEALAPLADDYDSWELLMGTIEYAGTCGEEFEKTAVEKALPYLAVALSAAPLIEHYGNKMVRDRRIKKSLAAIMREHPELRRDPNVSKYFQAIVDFAPDIAANSHVAGNVLQQMHQIGPGALTPRAIGELLSVQADHARRPTPGGMAGDIAGPLSKLHKSMSDDRKAAEKDKGRSGPADETKKRQAEAAAKLNRMFA